MGRVQRAPPSSSVVRRDPNRSGLTLDCDFAQRREALPIRNNAQVARTCRSCRTRCTLCGEKAQPQLRRHATGPHLSRPEQGVIIINSLFSGGVATMTIRHRLSLWLSRALSFQPTVQYKGREETQCALAARLATFAVAVTRCVLLPIIRVTTARTMLCRSCSPHSFSCLQPPTSGL